MFLSKVVLLKQKNQIQISMQTLVCGLWLLVWQVKEFIVCCGTKFCTRWQSSAAWIYLHSLRWRGVLWSGACACHSVYSVCTHVIYKCTCERAMQAIVHTAVLGVHGGFQEAPVWCIGGCTCGRPQLPPQLEQRHGALYTLLGWEYKISAC